VRLSSLAIRGVRNLEEVSIEPGDGINLLYGDNGAGKTSLLESIFILAHGRSFRSGKIQTIVNNNAEELSVSALVENQKLKIESRIGILRGRHVTQARIDGRSVNRISELASALPCIVISARNHELIEGGPTERRSFIDWLLFHVDQSYLPLHRRYKTAMQQRNAALRNGSPASLIKNWDVELAESGEQLSTKRLLIVNQFAEKYSLMAESLDEDLKPVFSFRRGWPEDITLAESLIKNFPICQRNSLTSIGPHRADLKIVLGKNEAKYVNSRGQQKLLAIIMKLVQVELFTAHNHEPPVILIDDPPSELDAVTRQFVFDYLENTSAQVFLTSVNDVSNNLQSSANVFHVKRGKIEKVIY
jgi:DNA replication and repair protein RecF